MLGIDQVRVKVDVNDVSALGELIRSHLHSSLPTVAWLGLLVSVHEALEQGRTRHVAALADELRRAPHGVRVQARELQACSCGWRRACRGTSDALCQGRRVRRRRAAANEVEELVLGTRHHGRGVTARCRQTPAQVERRQGRAGCPHVRRTVHADSEWLGMANAREEGLEALARLRAEALLVVDDVHRDQQRQAILPGCLEVLVYGVHRCLCVQGVRDHEEREHVHAAINQPTDLLTVGCRQLVKGCVPQRGVLAARRGGQRPRRGSEDAGHEAGPVPLLRGDLRRGLLRQLRGGLVQLVCRRLGPILLLRNA
mmetsp:Transcript_44561/g.115287  ORF Transcript_44561/g.115287 Transcript_44561/m.115287 type:complete len:313 (-) Transcript_44561:2065-3003(-)